MAIGRFVLRAKAWQVFVIVVGLYSSGEFCSIATSVRGPGAPWNYALMVLGVVCFDGVVVWLWLLGSCLAKLVPIDEQRVVRSLSIAGIIFICYSIISVFVRGPREVIVIVVFALIALVCFLYMVDFAAASLLAAEGRKTPAFREYAKPFFLLLAFPLGIWFIQPRLNRVYDAKWRKLSASHC